MTQRLPPRHKLRRRTPPGAAPGTLTVAPDSIRPQIQIIAYGPDGLEENSSAGLTDLAAVPATPVRWINLDGLGDIATLQQIGSVFGLHPLALEDIVNLHQRPKVEAYDNCLFIVLRMPVALPSAVGVSPSRLETEQVTLALGSDFVITFQDRPGDIFGPVRHRLRSPDGQIRQRGPDYLAYTLIDAAIDGFFPILA